MAINEDALESPLESALDFSVIGVVMLDSRLGALDEAQPSDSCPARLIQVKETSFSLTRKDPRIGYLHQSKKVDATKCRCLIIQVRLRNRRRPATPTAAF